MKEKYLPGGEGDWQKKLQQFVLTNEKKPKSFYLDFYSEQIWVLGTLSLMFEPLRIISWAPLTCANCFITETTNFSKGFNDNIRVKKVRRVSREFWKWSETEDQP